MRIFAFAFGSGFWIWILDTTSVFFGVKLHGARTFTARFRIVLVSGFSVSLSNCPYAYMYVDGK